MTHAHAHPVIFLTLFDDFWLVMNEALSQELPVITTDRGGVADLLGLVAMDL